MKYYITVILLLNVLLAQSYVIDTNRPVDYRKPAKNPIKRNTNITPYGVNYVGIGYNLLHGNPDGSPNTAQQDPGLRGTYRVFNLTNKNNKPLPDQISYIKSLSCINTTQQRMFSNEYSYAKKFDLDVTFSVYSKASSNFESQSYVTFENVSYCYKGEARYKLELAGTDKYPLTKSFVTTVNELPTKYSMHNPSYMEFLETFGTHVVTNVFLGTKKEHRYYWTGSEFASFVTKNYATSSSLSAGYKGYSASIEVETSSMTQKMSKQVSSSSMSESKTLGDASLALPYAYTLIDMDKIFEAKFWHLHQHYVDGGYLSSDFYGRLSDMKSNMHQALTDYPDFLNSKETKEEEIFRLPVTWPIGTYGLPKTKSGCPGDITNDYTFYSGTRFQDSEDKKNGNEGSNPNHFPVGTIGIDMTQHFCMKTIDKFTPYDRDWPDGEYCIFKGKHSDCPTGLEQGMIAWDDEDKHNSNWYTGSLPDGVYDYNTKIYYCCQRNGYAEQPIYLPTDVPFYLFPYEQQCQAVKGMKHNMERLRFICNKQSNGNHETKPHPFRHGGRPIQEIYYCYYTPE
ncbi:uncharacterized protein [Antedon mediterranea]|uniref:uncharacterized protein n=1 Tax=Antedon mediterranea TaxID=105859 RepID=UPI003AF94C22